MRLADAFNSVSAVGVPPHARHVMPATHPVHSPEDTSRFVLTPVQTVTRLLGVVLLVIGTLGVASHIVGIDLPGRLEASAVSEPILAGVGIGGIVLDRTVKTARRYLTAVGIGLFTGGPSPRPV